MFPRLPLGEHRGSRGIKTHYLRWGQPLSAITHACIAIVLVTVAVKIQLNLNSLKPNKRQNNEQPNEHKTNERLAEQKAESAENISGMKRNRNI